MIEFKVYAASPWSRRTIDTPSSVATCPRCGISRQVDPRRNTRLCRDCRSVDPHWGETAQRIVTARSGGAA